MFITYHYITNRMAIQEKTKNYIFRKSGSALVRSLAYRSFFTSAGNKTARSIGSNFSAYLCMNLGEADLPRKENLTGSSNNAKHRLGFSDCGG